MKSKYLVVLSSLLFFLNVSAQTCNTGMIKEKPTALYSISVDGAEVTDSQTGLTWKRCVEGMYWDSGNSTCSGTATTFTWDDALVYAASQSSWRLPNIKELRTLVEPACNANSINETVFPATPSATWSSSPDISDYTRSWFCDFSNTNTNIHWSNKSNSYVVRLVK